MMAKSDETIQRIVWSDEKKFNLDGPDSLRYYWHDLRDEKTIFSKRHSGGGSVMVWGGLTFFGVTPLAFVDKKLDSDSYQDLLSEFLLPEAPILTGGHCILMQDNAPPHRSCSTKRWLSRNEVEVISWPPYSPDLNPIENLWGWLTRKVYANGRQFDNKNDLKSAIITCWSEIPIELCESLVSSVRNRCIKVIQKNGGSINY